MCTCYDIMWGELQKAYVKLSLLQCSALLVLSFQFITVEYFNSGESSMIYCCAFSPSSVSWSLMQVVHTCTPQAILCTNCRVTVMYIGAIDYDCSQSSRFLNFSGSGILVTVKPDHRQ